MSQHNNRGQLLTRIRESLAGSLTFKQLDDVGAQLSGLGRMIVADLELEFDEAMTRQESSAA